MKHREEIIGGCRLILGDCLEVMPQLGVKSVDHAIFDPPYEDSMHENFAGLSRLRKDGGSKDSHSELGFSSISKIRKPVCELLAATTVGWFVLFCTSEGVAAWRDTIEEVNVKYKRACIWHKPDAAPQFNGQGPALAHEMIVTAWAGKGHSKWNAGGKRGFYQHNTNQPERINARNGGHPTEKPLPLMMDLVSDFTNFGETVLDCFMGSGTTGVACAKLGRKFIGIEMEEKYFDLSCRRVEKAYRQTDMFIKQPEKMTQGDLI